MTISGAVYREGVAYTPDGAVYVQHTDGATQANPIFTGAADATGLTSIAGIERMVAQSAIPFVVLSSGSVAANGAISAITALPAAYAHAFCYFPANALATTIAAGWHYCTFSTTTAGVAYLNTYTSGVPSIPASPTAVTDGKGAFTGVTTTVAGPSITIAAGALGANGYLRSLAAFSGTDNGNSKQFFQYLNGSGGLTLGAANIAATNVHVTQAWVMNRGSQASQVVPAGQGGVGGWSGQNADALYGTQNLASASTFDISLAHAGAATDNMILEAFAVFVSYKA